VLFDIAAAVMTRDTACNGLPLLLLLLLLTWLLLLAIRWLSTFACMHAPKYAALKRLSNVRCSAGGCIGRAGLGTETSAWATPLQTAPACNVLLHSACSAAFVITKCQLVQLRRLKNQHRNQRPPLLALASDLALLLPIVTASTC
jgi:hypothetical protein